MTKKQKALLIGVAVFGLLSTLIIYLYGSNFQVLNAKGAVAEQERNLLIFGVILSLIIVVPVYVMTFTFAWKYRASNHKAKYRPDWDHNLTLETIWWLVPLLLITILSVVTWKSSHDLDPFKPLVSDQKPLPVQVVALQWKWLFIYPEQNVATVNYLQIPEDRPINFQITSDGPMNSFWIPQLGSQIYAMSGMSTKVHLMANEPGNYEGSSANISGEGFAGMRFDVRATTQSEFESWIEFTKRRPAQLNLDTYTDLAKPSSNVPVAYYAASERGLYDKVVMKYMRPGSDIPHTQHNPGAAHEVEELGDF